MRSKFILLGVIVFYSLICNSTILFSQQKSDSNNSTKVYKNRTTLDLINLIASNIISDTLKDGQFIKGDWEAVKNSRKPEIKTWKYPTGVSMLALQQVFTITRDSKYLEYVKTYARISADWYAYIRWQAFKFGKPYETDALTKLYRLDMLDDYGAIGASFLECKMRHNLIFTANLNDLIGILDNQIVNVQYRLDNKSFWRPNSPDGPTIWGDDLFMSLPFVVRLAEYKKDQSLYDDAAQQIINYASYLQDSDGVFFHGYYVDQKTHTCCKWGRANGWIAVALADVLTALPKDHPKREQVFKIYKKQLDGLIKLQSSDGLWNQVLDHPELSWGTETTCSAQFTFSIARGINMGWLDASYIPVVKKSLQALSSYSRINENGILLRVCPSTSLGKDLDYYNSLVPEDAGYSDHHGDGLVLLALTEMYNLLEKEKNKK